MGQSHNPAGTAKVTDQKLVDSLDKAISNSPESTLAVPSRDVADLLPIKKQAVGKRLDRLAKADDSDVKRFKGSQAWLYYLHTDNGGSNQQIRNPPPASSSDTHTLDTDSDTASLQGKLLNILREFI